MGKPNFNKCTLAVRKFPLERFRLPSDGPRKWRQVAERRRGLLLELSTYANGDGTFERNEIDYSPSEKTLVEVISSRRTLYRLQDALKELGLLEWERKDHYHKRRYLIHLPDESHVPDQQENRCQINSEQVPNQFESGAKSEDETPKQVPNQAKTRATVERNIRLSPSFEEPSLPPVDPEKLGSEVASLLTDMSGLNVTEHCVRWFINKSLSGFSKRIRLSQ